MSKSWSARIRNRTRERTRGGRSSSTWTECYKNAGREGRGTLGEGDVDVVDHDGDARVLEGSEVHQPHELGKRVRAGRGCFGAGKRILMTWKEAGVTILVFD